MNQVRVASGSQCVAVRYAPHAAPMHPCIGYCRMYERQLYNYFGSTAGVDKKDFELTRGQLFLFQSFDDAERLFCAKYRTPLGYGFFSRPRIAVSNGFLTIPRR